MSTTKPTHLTITLTDRPPVRIATADWPILTSAAARLADYTKAGQQTTRSAQWRLTVRQHGDGRTIVYGVHKYDTQWREERGRNIRGGEQLDPGADIPAALRRVAASLQARIPGAVGIYGKDAPYGDPSRFAQLAHEATAGLPVVDL